MNKCMSAVIITVACAAAAYGQGPAGDEIRVTFDRSVQVGHETLAPGDYTIRQVTSASNPRVLSFTSKASSKVEATVAAIPIMQNIAPPETKVEIQDEGGGARLARIWVQGKNYGYEFPGMATTAAQQQPATVARLEGSFAPQAADRAAPAQPEPAAPAPQAEARPMEPAPAPPPPAPEVAQANPEPTPAPTPAPQATPDVPATDLGWGNLMVAGAGLAAFGALLMFRRRAA